MRRLMIGTLLLLASEALNAAERLSLELETGPAWSGYNDVRIPGDAGTLLSFSEELQTRTAAYLRAQAVWRIGRRHAIRFLAAPLRFEAAGSVARPVRFENATFEAGVPLVGRYRFDSYRLTYRRSILSRPRLELALGLTAKIRDATVELSDGALRAEKSNIGPVPLLHFLARYKAADRVSFILEGDAAAAPQGRAEDILVAVECAVGPKLALRAGYRLLEGGADNDEVYTFTWVNYGVAGLVLRF
ncbi:MAG: hypothetical protein JXO72_13640 [Vicinamibacteria bacterium]|nr:hypothetical protein [Vicinamibacteria bacterium]